MTRKALARRIAEVLFTSQQRGEASFVTRGHTLAIGYSRPRIFLDFLQLLPSLPKMKKALVAGALGVTGRTLVNHLVSLGDWEVFGLSRRSPEFQTAAKYVAVDLSDRSAVGSQLNHFVSILTELVRRLQTPG